MSRTDSEIVQQWGRKCTSCGDEMAEGEGHVHRSIIPLVGVPEDCSPVTSIYVVCRECNSQKILV